MREYWCVKMNLFDSSFLCLDIGTSGVRGIAHRVRSGRIDKSAMYSVDNYDTVFALKSVIDELENKIGTHFDTAYITGNFGNAWFTMTRRETLWSGEHKITPADIKAQISQITPPDGFYPMHIVPLRYDGATTKNMPTPIGVVERKLASVFGGIFYEQSRMDEIGAFLRRAHIQPAAFFDPMFLVNASYPANGTQMIIDFGAEFTSVSIWSERGPVWHYKYAHGGTNITREIAEKTNVGFDDAERIKRTVASMIPKEMDRFTPADTAYDFSRSDINDIVIPNIVDIVGQIKNAAMTAIGRYAPRRIVITGGASGCDGVADLVENMFAIPVENMGPDAATRALSEYIWAAEGAHRAAYIARSERMQKHMSRIRGIFTRRRRKRNEFIPIMPSTLCFDMRRDETYSLFQSGGVSIVHVDIMDGFYVDRIAGGIDELKYIRAHTDAHLHVHLMTEGPVVWANDAIAAGANTIIVSTNTSGVRTALHNIRAAGVRAGVALHPDSSVSILKSVLRDVDEVMVMTVAPGAAGQAFNPECLHKISVLAATRKRYGLRFTISVDGGINDKTAQMCWDAGADLLVSGSYLARANDFPLAIRGLMRKTSA